jgi:hypothetical protein
MGGAGGVGRGVGNFFLPVPSDLQLLEEVLRSARKILCVRAPGNLLMPVAKFHGRLGQWYYPQKASKNTVNLSINNFA